MSEVTTADALAILTPIWHDKPETARRVRQRIGAVMKWAVAMGYRPDNPAGDALGQALGRQQAVVQHMRALPHHGSVADALASVRASQAASETVTVTYATSVESGDTATSDDDFTAASATLTFAANETRKTIRVITMEDNVFEGDETFTLTLSNVQSTGLVTIADETATGTIDADIFDELDDCQDGASFVTRCAAYHAELYSGRIASATDLDAWSVILDPGKTYQIDVRGAGDPGGDNPGTLAEHQRSELAAFCLLQPVDGANVRVIERGEHLGLALEARQPIRVGGERLGHLERHVPVELRVSGSAHLPHSAFADLGGDLIYAEAGAGSEGHGRVRES